MTTITEGLHARLSLNISDYLAKLKRAEAEAMRMAKEARDAGRVIQRSLGGAMDRSGTAATLMRRKVGGALDFIRRKARAVRGAFGGMRGMLLKIGAAIGTVLGVHAIVRFSQGMSKAASDFEETATKFHAVFKEFSADALAWADRFASSVGRAKTEILAWMARLQDTFVPLGFARDKAAQLSSQITMLGVDLASFNNMVDTDVIENLTSAITGQHIAVRKYGVVLNEASLNQALWNVGISGGVRAATNLEKVQARLTIIMSATKDAQGDAIRTAGSFENQMKFLKAAIEDVKVELGDELNKVILEFIHEGGGATAVSKKLKLALIVVVEAAKMGVKFFGMLIGRMGEYIREAGGAEAAAFKVSVAMKRVEVGMRFLGHIGRLISQGIVIMLSNLQDLGHIVVTIFKTVGRLLAGAVLIAVVKIADAVANVVKALVWLGDLVGLTEDAATKIDIFQSNLKDLEKSAQTILKGMRTDWDGYTSAVARSNRLFNQYARDQKRSWAGIKKASQEVMDLTVQAEQAQSTYNRSVKARIALEKLKEGETLQTRLSREAAQAREVMSTLKEQLRERILFLKDAAKEEEEIYKKTLDRYKEMLQHAQSAYRQHITRLNALDREHLQFNESIEERVFRLRTRNLAPDAQIQALRSAVREFESRAGGALRGGNFQEGRRLLDKASRFLEEMTSIDPSLDMAETVSSELEMMQRRVNQIFQREAQYHTKGARESLFKQIEVKNLMDEMTVKQEAWREAFKATMAAWDRLGDANIEQLRGFKEELDAATQKRQVFIEAVTEQALKALRELQGEIDALHGKSIEITIRRGVEAASEKKSFARGGLVQGSREVGIRAHGGEYVVNKAATRNYLPFLKEINRQGLQAPSTQSVSPPPVQSISGDTIDMGGINITIQSSGDAKIDAVELATQLRREIRRGRARSLG